MVKVTSLFFAYRIHGKNDEVFSNTAVMIMMIVSVNSIVGKYGNDNTDNMIIIMATKLLWYHLYDHCY